MLHWDMMQLSQFLTLFQLNQLSINKNIYMAFMVSKFRVLFRSGILILLLNLKFSHILVIHNFMSTSNHLRVKTIRIYDSDWMRAIPTKKTKTKPKIPIPWRPLLDMIKEVNNILIFVSYSGSIRKNSNLIRSLSSRARTRAAWVIELIEFEYTNTWLE